MQEEVLDKSSPKSESGTDFQKPAALGSRIKKSAKKLNIIMKSYDSKMLDQTAQKVKETLNKIGIASCGPIPLVRKTRNFVVLKSPHVNKDARQNFRIDIMKRLVQVEESRATVAALHGMKEVHPSVNVEIKVVENKQKTTNRSSK